MGRAYLPHAELAVRDWVCGKAGFRPRTAVWTEHTSTAVRLAAAGVGVCAASAHVVRGAVGEDCAILTPDPVWRRTLTVHARVPPTGAAEAFVDHLRATWPDLARVRRHDNRGLPAAPS
ncbi:hypothetical protein LK07_27900 [Streptomyces pluripotens]|uniref:LysR substrate-binding domain-containing protein n=1 Tax=Streptomyces pluripotens TaxID=1355015 RepID=A0A221P4N3_9ACTN|nr:hypothetical protein LK06_026740 [Streptomyces pluripotens]ASN27219.1 hypothetical protein LK07_27900 [Streptomyces pluripotens]KIE28779.1 hypothetical protein LK08_01930 [Streptomyces sp. MUSC 125]